MRMRFFFADSHDYVDPRYDFERDEYGADRQVQRDDLYAHEYFERPPYDGILVSRAIVGDERRHGKYSTAQMYRFRRDGAAAFLRYDFARHNGAIMGDCGAFSYVKEYEPPFTVPQMVEYYAECGFTHAVSIDHVILDYTEKLDTHGSLFQDLPSVPEEWKRRFDLTLRLAEEFREHCRDHEAPFHPIGVAQGWSPRSYAEAVRQLVQMGYDYVAIGGLVPLKVQQIQRVLEAVRAVAPRVRLHLFGFTKADDIEKFVPYEIESFDSTSPMLRAFKDGTKNYLLDRNWYTAIRVPHADESRRFKEDVLAGLNTHRRLREMEEAALTALRRYAAGDEHDVETVLAPLMKFGMEFAGAHPDRSARDQASRDMQARERRYRETLLARPWENCPCAVCRQLGIEVVIFRGNNRNRRRGFHNLWEYYRQLRALRGEGEPVQHAI